MPTYNLPRCRSEKFIVECFGDALLVKTSAVDELQARDFASPSSLCSPHVAANRCGTDEARLSLPSCCRRSASASSKVRGRGQAEKPAEGETQLEINRSVSHSCSQPQLPSGHGDAAPAHRHPALSVVMHRGADIHNYYGFSPSTCRTRLRHFASVKGLPARCGFRARDKAGVVRRAQGMPSCCGESERHWRVVNYTHSQDRNANAVPVASSLASPRQPCRLSLGVFVAMWVVYVLQRPPPKAPCVDELERCAEQFSWPDSCAAVARMSASRSVFVTRLLACCSFSHADPCAQHAGVSCLQDEGELQSQELLHRRRYLVLVCHSVFLCCLSPDGCNSMCAAEVLCCFVYRSRSAFIHAGQQHR